MTSAGAYDGFVARYSEVGSLFWAKRLGGVGIDTAPAIALGTDRIVVAGNFENTVDFDPGAGVQNRMAAGGTDFYLEELNLDGSFIRVSTFGGNVFDLFLMLRSTGTKTS